MSEQKFVFLKHGTSVVEQHGGVGIAQDSIEFFAFQHASLHGMGWETAEVASGAHVAGLEYLLDQGKDPKDYSKDVITLKGIPPQANSWMAAAEPFDFDFVPALLTNREIDDTAEEGRNIIENTRLAVEAGDVMVFNENPLTSNKELKAMEVGGDNDWLAAHLAIATGASHLVYLTNRAGFEVDGEVQREIRVADIPEMIKYCGEVGLTSEGGMESKLRAAETASNAGIDVMIADAFGNIANIIQGDAGTRVVQ